MPSCEFIDGVLRPKPMPNLRDHGILESQLTMLINRDFPQFAAGSEVNVEIRPGKYLVPDLVFRG